MKKRHALRPALVLILCAIGAFLAGAQEQPPSPIQRFALVVGANGGGLDRVRLRYADSDARSFATVLTELGGIRNQDLILLADPGLSAFHDALQRMAGMVAAAESGGKKCELIVYYSGHSDETGLLLGTDRFPYAALRGEIERIPAGVRVAILDSCSSGAMTRAKGGVSRPAFLFDASTEMKGHAYLTSSSAEESAQESDRLGASYFTHYLVSGLRGAADLNGEGVVTLNEAYAFAFKETLASTENARYGPQHPAYEINLTGSGDLVLTDLRATSAGLSLGDGLYGRMYIRDAHGSLVVELNKSEGKRMEIGLEPGLYTLVLDRQGARYRAAVTVAENQRTVIATADFQKIASEASTARGDEGGQDNKESNGNATQFFNIAVIPNFSEGLFSSHGDYNVSINVLAGSSASLAGFETAGLANIESRKMVGYQTAGLCNIVRGDVIGFQNAGLVNYGGNVRAMQYAGLANIATSELHGFQAAGLTDVVLGETYGVQLAGGVSYSRGKFAGIQVSGLTNHAAAVTGFQVAGLGNIVRDDARFFQAAGVVNYGGEVRAVRIAGLTNIATSGFRGFQTAGFGNVVLGDSYGLQIAGGINYSKGKLVGLDVSGLGNYAEAVTGVQIGLVNVTGTVGGVQVGLVNVDRRIDGLALGLISLESGGIHNIETWWSTDSTANLGFKLGTRHTYTLFEAGYTPSSDPVDWSCGLGWGGRIAIGSLFLDSDLSWRNTFLNSHPWNNRLVHQQPELRLLVGIPAVGFSIIAGAALDARLPGIWKESDGSYASTFNLVPRLIIGIQI